MPPKAPKVALVSLGCPKNLIDSERMLALLAEGGCMVGAPVGRAEVILINTCGFLASARQESLEAIAEAAGRKHRGKARRVVVAGCLAARDGEKLYAAVPGIDAIVGLNDREEILSAVLGEGRITKLGHCPTGGPGRVSPIATDAGRFRLTPRHTAYLRIAEGCSRRCTFCTIPAIRGPLRSKPPRTVLQEAAELVADGAAELNIVGQDTTSYGRDLGGRCDLAVLLRRLDSLSGLRWLRLMYAYPRRVSRRIIDAMAGCPRVVHYLDLPLQHVSDPVLRRMGRGTSRRTIETLLADLRRRMGDIVIRTTFIVGFPGETDKAFQELLRFVRDFRFAALGAFRFSPEEGTAAAAMPGQVPEEVKAGRAEELMLAQQEIAFQANRRMVGKKLEVLVDGVNSAGGCVGRYCGQAPEVDGVCLLKRRRPTGGFHVARVIGWEGYDLIVD
jgi:ribosomal protein S12 methylthiotransferase